MQKEKRLAFDPYDFEKTEIDGVPVYWKNFPTSPCIHIDVCFNVGSLYDTPDRAGMSHFLEHMIFDGSPTLPTKKAITEWSKVYALNSWNAWTYFTNTNFYLRCLPEHFDTALAGMRDMIFHPLLRAEDIEHERQVITQEAWGVFKNEKFLAFCKEMLANQYAGTARAHAASPLGWPETIAHITREDVAEWHARNYGKGNFFIVLAGPITKTHLTEIKKFLKDIPQAKNKKLNFGVISKPKKLLIRKTGEEIGDPREQVDIGVERVMKSSDAPRDEVRKMDDSLLQDILFERLRTERALCYGVSVHSNLQKDFLISAITIEADEKNEKLIVKELWKAIADVTSGAEKKRFDTLKKTNIDRLKSSEEVTKDIVHNSLFDIIQHGEVTTHSQSVRARENVSYADVSKYIAKVFDKKWTMMEVIVQGKK